MTRPVRLSRLLATLVVAASCLTVTLEVSPGPDRSVSLALGSRAEAIDLVKEAWGKFRNKVMDKVVGLIKTPVAQAQAGLKKLISGALARLQKVFESDVILPALIWALPKVFPGSQKILDYVRQAIGSIDRLTQSARNYTAAVDALIQKDQAKLGAAMAKVNGSSSLFEKFDVAQVVDVLLRAAKEKAPAFIKAKTLELLNKALSVIEAPIHAGKAAATAALGSIPVLGPFISGSADFVITEGLTLIRQKGFEYVATKAVEFANKAIDAIGKQLKGGAASKDKRLKPVIAAINGFMKTIKPYLEPLRKGFERLKAAFVMADQGPAALAALTFVKKAYDEFVGLLKKNIEAAKAKLQSLANKAKTVLPTVGTFLKPILDGLADAGELMIKEIASCKGQLLGFNGTVLTAVFGCMKNAVVRGIASGAFESFLKLLRNNMAQAKEKLKSLVGKLAVVFPQAKTMAGPIVTALDSVGDAVVDGAGLCKARITGLNKETAQGLLLCLGEAVKSAGAAVVRGLARGFEQLWRTGCRAALPKLKQMGTLISRVFVALAPVVKRVTGVLQKRCEGR